MINKTHLALASALMLLFLPHINNKFLFVPVILIASLLPDIDSASSQIGRRWFFRPLQWFLKHRGMIHSFTFCIIVSLLLAFFIPVLSLPFFLGYFSHLFADSLTIEGIRPFWPMKKEISGHMRTGSAVEEGVFLSLIFINVAIFISWFI